MAYLHTSFSPLNGLGREPLSKGGVNMRQQKGSRRGRIRGLKGLKTVTILWILNFCSLAPGGKAWALEAGGNVGPAVIDGSANDHGNINNTAVGFDSKANLQGTATGRGSGASQNGSTATGKSARDSGQYSTATGWESQATGPYSTATGVLSRATGVGSTATGVDA